MSRTKKGGSFWRGMDCYRDAKNEKVYRKISNHKDRQRIRRELNIDYSGPTWQPITHRQNNYTYEVW